MSFSLKQLEAFVWVADLASFGKAAERLNTTQPNISSRIAGLERTFDVTLMERGSGSVSLTPKGQELLHYARQVLRASENLQQAADQASLYDGVLKLGVTEMIVHTWLRGYLKLLKQKFPEILVELTVDLSVNLTAGLASRTIDLALQSGPFSDTISGSQELGSYPWIWLAAPSVVDAGAELSMADMAKFPILTHARATAPHLQVREHFAGVRGLRLVPSSNLAACRQMTVDNMGIAALPEAMVGDELQSGELVRINYAWSPPDLCFEARYQREHAGALVQQAARLAQHTAQRKQR